MSENSSISSSVKIKCLIDMALTNEISWPTLNFVIDTLAPTLEKSKEIIKIILKEFEEFQSRQSQNRDQNEQVESVILNEEDHQQKSKANDNLESDCNQSDVEEDIIEAVRNIETESGNDSEDLEDESVVPENAFEANDTSNEPLYTFVEIKNEYENQDGNTDVEDHSNEVPEMHNQSETGVPKIQENSSQEILESEKDEMNHNKSKTAKKIEVIKLKILPQPKEKKLQCNICAKYFKYYSCLNRHHMNHNVEKSFQCKTCLKTFSEKGTLKRHEIIHSGLKPFECNICKMSFNDSGNLNAHKKIHSGEKPYVCKTCGKCFRIHNTLKTHARIHNDERPFQCKNCDKTFRQSSCWKVHVRKCKSK